METQTPAPPNEGFFRALEIERTRALVDRDVEKVPGRVMSLERYLFLMAQDVFYANWEHGPMRVLLSPGMAVVRYQAKITFPSGKVVDCWHTDIYALHAGTWRAVWSQGTQLPQEQTTAGGAQ